jgi:hypothetical protein
MNRIYKLTHKDYRGAAYAMYKKGELSEFLFAFDPALRLFDSKSLANQFPFKETDLAIMKNVARFDYTELVPRNVTDKIALFCMSFRKHFNSPYTAKKEERANIADVSVTQPLIDLYFSVTDFPLSHAKTINDYIRHYNHIRSISVNGVPKKGGFPDVYDREYERGLDGEKLSAYRSHLVALGWRKMDDTWRLIEQPLNQI